jgi:hypothetical protein
MLKLIAIIAVLIPLVVPCASAQSAEPASANPAPAQNATAATSAPDPKALEDLKKQIEEIFAALKNKKQKDRFDALVNDLRLPDERALFSAVFGNEIGEAMAKPYADAWPRFQAVLERVLETDHDEKRTDISVRVAVGRDVPFRISQVAAAMKAPTVLYAVSASKHGKEDWTLPGSYVLADGHFRCIPQSVFTSIPGVKPGRIRIGGNVEQAKVAKSVPPIYPQEAKDAHVAGTVVLHAVIGIDGSVQDVSYISGPQLLLRPAADAVEQWRYQVTYLNGDPVEVDTTITVHFVLGQ